MKPQKLFFLLFLIDKYYYNCLLTGSWPPVILQKGALCIPHVWNSVEFLLYFHIMCYICWAILQFIVLTYITLYFISYSTTVYYCLLHYYTIPYVITLYNTPLGVTKTLSQSPPDLGVRQLIYPFKYTVGLYLSIIFVSVKKVWLLIENNIYIIQTDNCIKSS